VAEGTKEDGISPVEMEGLERAKPSSSEDGGAGTMGRAVAPRSDAVAMARTVEEGETPKDTNVLRLSNNSIKAPSAAMVVFVSGSLWGRRRLDRTPRRRRLAKRRLGGLGEVASVRPARWREREVERVRPVDMGVERVLGLGEGER